MSKGLGLMMESNESSVRINCAKRMSSLLVSVIIKHMDDMRRKVYLGASCGEAGACGSSQDKCWVGGWLLKLDEDCTGTVYRHSSHQRHLLLLAARLVEVCGTLFIQGQRLRLMLFELLLILQ